MSTVETATSSQTPLSAQEHAVLGSIDRGALTRDLVDLVRIPSISGSEAENEIQHLLARRLSSWGLDVDYWPLDLAELRAQPDFPGWEVERPESWGLVATTGPGRPALTLQGHVDVVPVGDPTSWGCDPFRAEPTPSRVYGRGACDMKAGLVANLAALRAVLDSGVRLSRPASLHCVVGEEDGGLGAYATLRRGHTADGCLISEPTSGTVVTANAGALTFELVVPGASTHASTSYAGQSALHHFIPLLLALQELEQERNRRVDALMDHLPVAYPISVGRVRAGDWASTVPDLLVAEGRMGVALDEDPADARAALESRVHEAAARVPWLRDHPPKVGWSGGQYASGRLPDEAPVVDLLTGAIGAVDPRADTQRRGAPYGSDLRLYVGAGVPTLHYGPGAARHAHSPEEHVEIADLVRTTEVLALTLLRACR